MYVHVYVCITLYSGWWLRHLQAPVLQDTSVQEGCWLSGGQRSSRSHPHLERLPGRSTHGSVPWGVWILCFHLFYLLLLFFFFFFFCTCLWLSKSWIAGWETEWWPDLFYCWILITIWWDHIAALTDIMVLFFHHFIVSLWGVNKLHCSVAVGSVGGGGGAVVPDSACVKVGPIKEAPRSLLIWMKWAAATKTTHCSSCLMLKHDCACFYFDQICNDTNKAHTCGGSAH